MKDGISAGAGSSELESMGTNLAYEPIELENIGILAGKDTSIARQNISGTQVTGDVARGDSFFYLTKRHSARVIQDKLFRKIGFAPHVLLETDSLEMGRRFAVEAGACMILPDIYVGGRWTWCSLRSTGASC